MRNSKIMNQGRMIGFKTRASASVSKALVQGVIDIIQREESRKRARNAGAQASFEQAVDFILGDLLKAYIGETSQYAYRAEGKTNFYGSPVGHTTWKAVMPVLIDLGYVEYHVGVNHKLPFDVDSYIGGKASRFMATDSLVALAESHGVSLDAVNELYHTELPNTLLILRSDKRGNLRGAKMEFTETEQTQAIINQVKTINEYLSQQTLTGGVFEGYRRTFNIGDASGYNWDKGGRLYAVGSSYQHLSGERRASMAINAEPVVEIDVSASHLSIYVGLMGGEVLGGTDLYDVETFDRSIVKAFITASFGQGKLALKWPKGADIDVDINEVKQAICEVLPCLTDLDHSGHSWATLQFLEAEAIIEAMEALQAVDIPAYAVHDSLIVPDSGADNARAFIRKAWESRGWPIALG